MHVLKTQKLLHSGEQNTTGTPPKGTMMKKKLQSRKMAVPGAKYPQSNAQVRLLEKKTPSVAQNKEKQLQDTLVATEKKLNHYKQKKKRLESKIAMTEKKNVAAPGHLIQEKLRKKLPCRWRRPTMPKI